MKRNEIIARLQTATEATKLVDCKELLSSLIAELQSTTEPDKGKLVYTVQIHKMVQNPACKYPLQMVQCHNALWSASAEGTIRLTRKECVEAIEKSGTVVTRQSIDRIYAFYQKRMEDEGWIGRETIRE